MMSESNMTAKIRSKSLLRHPASGTEASSGYPLTRNYLVGTTSQS
jgi:hypothetical protein